MTATETRLTLDAWGGTIHDGDECWIIDEIEYTLTRVESARIVQVNYDPCLLHENRAFKAYRVAASAKAARERLEASARELLAMRSKREQAARLFLASLT